MSNSKIKFRHFLLAAVKISSSFYPTISLAYLDFSLEEAG